VNIQPTTSPVSKASTRRRGITLFQVLMVIVILGMVVALLLPAQRRVRPATYRAICKNNLKQIGLALHNYHDTFHAFPPAYTVDADGKPLHSWRALILPFLDQQNLYETIDLSKPWDDQANSEAHETVMQPYRCSSLNADVPQGHTTYLAVVTPGSCLRPVEPRSMSDITDDPGDTLVVIEVDSKHSVHWMSPVDADDALVLGMNPKSKLAHTGGVNALYVDGRVMFLGWESTAADRKARISIAGDDQTDP